MDVAATMAGGEARSRRQGGGELGLWKRQNEEEKHGLASTTA